MPHQLTVSTPDDPFEREADRIAEAVLHAPESQGELAAGTIQRFPRPPLQRACACGGSSEGTGMCPACEEEPEKFVQRAAVGTESHPEVPPRVHEVLRSPGQPLEPSVRTFMEPRFGHDFSQVRVHTDAEAAKSAQGLSAFAYTVGYDIVFGRGQYTPGTPTGRKLLAHELAHVVQQTGGRAEHETRPTLVQRTIGDGHDLTAPRFAGNVALEAAFDPGDRRLIREGERGTHVQLIQQALLDMGYTLPEGEADGIFGPETEAAVERFQRDAGAVLIDGIVGPETMNLLDQHDVTNLTGLGPPALTGPLPSPRPAVGGGCAQHFTAVTFTLANQIGSGVTPAATIHVIQVGGNDHLLMDGIAPANYSPDVTINAPDDPTAQQYEVGIIQNLLSETLEYTYSTGVRLRSTLPTPIKDGAPLNSGVYHPIFAENGGGHPGILVTFAGNGDTVHLNLPDTPADGAFLNLLDNPECVGQPTPGTLRSAVFRDQFRTWIGARHRPSGCVITLHHIDWETDWSATCVPLPLVGTLCVPITNTIRVTEPDGDGRPQFIQGGQVPADLLAANRVCGP